MPAGSVRWTVQASVAFTRHHLLAETYVRLYHDQLLARISDEAPDSLLALGTYSMNGHFQGEASFSRWPD